MIFITYMVEDLNRDPNKGRELNSSTPETVDPGIRKLAEGLVEGLIEGSIWMAWTQVARRHGMDRAIGVLPKVQTILKDLTAEPSEEN